MVKSPVSSIDIPEVPVHTAMFARTAEYGDDIAIIDAVTGKEYTFQQFRDISQRIGSYLAKHGVEKGDVIAMFSYNCPEWIFMLFGGLFAGATITTVNHTYTKYELSHHLSNSGAKYLFTAEDMAGKAKLAARENPQVRDIFVVGESPGCISFDLLAKDDGSLIEKLQSLEFDVKNDLAFVPYSSGTTGLPKGVMITHYNVMANLSQLGHPDMVNLTLAASKQRILLFLPLYHAYGLVAVCLGVLAGGNTLVVLPGFQPHQFLRTIQNFKVTVLPLVPPLVIFMAKSPLVKQYDLSSILRIGSGAAPLSKDVELELEKRLKVPEIRQGFGMTETTCVGSTHIPTKPSPPGSSGVLLANMEGKIMDVHSGKELGPRERGELWLKGPNIMKGYLNNPTATHQAIDSEGWLHTGDIVFYDDDGFFFIVDRIKELIKVKGLQVAPAELEALLLTHPQIDDVGVVGLPDERAGELPRAYVVPKPGQKLSESEVEAFVADRTATFKHLKGGVKFIDVIPRLPSGKIIRRQLQEQAKKEVGSKL